MTKQGSGPGPETQNGLDRQPSINYGLEVSSSLVDKKRLHEIASRRRYLALLGISLGCLLASALIVGLVEGIQAYRNVHITSARPLSSQVAGEDYRATEATRPSLSVALI